MPKVSVRSAVRDAARVEKQEVKRSRTTDSFQNFALGLGIGTNNASTGNTYGFNPISRNRTQLEWMHRGSWLAGAAVSVIADDMTREGVEIIGGVTPDEISAIEEMATELRIWDQVGNTIKWARLYGGAIAVLLIDGQDYSTPLRIEAIGPGQFKGLLVLDRWMVMPSLENLVTEPGPHYGLPKFYTAEQIGPALRGQRIHYTRCLRLVGDDLPYWQQLSENMWGMSVLERPFSIITQYEAATAGASQLVTKSYLRYFKIKDYRKTIATGGPAYQGLIAQVQNMRQFASNEGMTMMDADDDMVTTQASAFTGISEVILQLAEQISGDFQIPLVRLLGQSPGGLNSSGDSEMKTYAGGISQRQQRVKPVVTTIYRCIAASLGVKAGKGFGIIFRSIWQMDEGQKSEIAAKDSASILEVHASGIISDQTALRELQHTSKTTGRWKSITDEEIEAASDEVTPKGEPMDEPPAPGDTEGKEGGGDDIDERKTGKQAANG